MVELSDLEEAGSALLLGDECGTGVDALAFDDAEAFDVGTDVADVNVDDEVEDAASPTVAASVNRFVSSLQQLGFPQHQLSSPHFLTGAFSSCHCSPSAPSTTVQHRYPTHRTIITNTPQALRTLPRRIRTPISPP